MDPRGMIEGIYKEDFLTGGGGGAKVVSFQRLSATGMTSLILSSPLLKCLMTVCSSSHLL